MAMIQITPESLQNQAKTLRTHKTQHEEILQKIRQLVTALESEWKGETQAAFLASFNAKEPVFRQFAEEMEKFAAFMDTAANQMRETEAQLKSQAGQLA